MCVHAERFGAVRDNGQDQRRFSGRPCLRPATGVSAAAAMTSAAVTTTTAQTVAMTGPSRCTLPAWVPCKRFQVPFRSILLDKLTAQVARTLKEGVPLLWFLQEKVDQEVLPTKSSIIWRNPSKEGVGWRRAKKWKYPPHITILPPKANSTLHSLCNLPNSYPLFKSQVLHIKRGLSSKDMVLS